MKSFLDRRPWVLGALLGLGVLFGLFLILAIALQAGLGRGLLIHGIAAASGRQVQVGGSLRVRLLSRNPQLVAEGVTIGNPPWSPAGVTAQIGRITLVLKLPRWGRLFDVQRLEISGATLNLFRDSTGHANWQRRNPDEQAGRGAPLMNALSVTDTHVSLDDAFKRVQFDGSITAQDAGPAPGPQPLLIQGSGELNGRAATFEVIGDPLATATLSKPYGFSFVETSSGSRLTGKGFLKEPFDLSQSETTFEAAGDDLKDLYYLTGISLPNTGGYEFSGKISRNGIHTVLSELRATFGQSDVEGTVSTETLNGQRRLQANLTSQRLRSLDVGLRAAGRDSKAAEDEALLFPNALLNPEGLRRQNAVVDFQARRVEFGRVPLESLSGRVSMDRGLVVVTPLTAQMLGGTLEVRLTVDARTDMPTAQLALSMSDIQIGRFPLGSGAAAPLDGRLAVQADLTGLGRSMRQMAATVDGTVSATLPGGTIRASLAELTGLDVRGLGLLLTKSRQEAVVRCGALRFQAEHGTLTATQLLLDTDAVLITGAGAVHLDSETIDLAVTGHPKGMRFLEVHSPVQIRGTLKHPAFSIQAHNLVLVDRGRTQDVDCAALLGAQRAAGRSAPGLLPTAQPPTAQPPTAQPPTAQPPTAQPPAAQSGAAQP